MSFRRWRAVARKEALHILRDTRSLIAALAIPLVLLLLFGYALTLDVDRIPTHIFDLDRTPESRTLAERFKASRYFDVLGYVESYAPLERGVDDGSALLGVVIPRDYARTLQGDGQAEVQLLVDGSDSNTASLALNYAEGLIESFSLELRRKALDRKGGGELKPAVEARLRAVYNPELKSRNYIVPGLIAVILMIIAALLTSLAIAREWESGTMEQLLSTPVRPLELLLGKLSAYFALGFIDTAAAVTVGVWVFGVPLRGSVLLLISAACIFLFGALCWGLLISAVARSQLVAFQVSIITSFLPAFMLSGVIYAIENMPPPIQAFTYLIPARYFVTILKGVFLKGVGLDALWLEFALLGGYAAIMLLAAERKLRQKIA